MAMLAKWPEVIFLSKLDPNTNILSEKIWDLWNKIISLRKGKSHFISLENSSSISENSTNFTKHFSFLGEKHCLACQCNWKSILVCCIINVFACILGSTVAYKVCIHFPNPAIMAFPFLYGCFSLYVWFSPVSISSTILLSQYFNTLTKMTTLWSTSLQSQEYISQHLDFGFVLLEAIETGKEIFGEILCIEFFEIYSALVFTIFFGASTSYKYLRTTDDLHEVMSKNLPSNTDFPNSTYRFHPKTRNLIELYSIK